VEEVGVDEEGERGESGIVGDLGESEARGSK
jgi:hypothetical protein